MIHKTAKTVIAIVIFNLSFIPIFGQTNSEVIIPLFKDQYCESVRQLEAGQTDIDYRKFRESFIESEQFKVASKNIDQLELLQKEMYLQMNASNYAEVIRITKSILSIDYTSMLAHKILRQTYKIVNDSTNAIKYKSIQFGLLNSIVKSGDGKSCEQAWSVIQISEEYFILNMIEAELLKQSIDNNGGVCDKMIVKTDRGENATYFFDITKVLEGYKKLGIK